jgi:hypothetical protein
MNTLVFHTLQSGTHDFQARHVHPSQPPMLALMASLFDTDDKEVDRMVSLVRLDGVTISNEAVAYHGIDTDMMMDEGLPLAEVLTQFAALAEGVAGATAFSVDHHAAVVRIALVKAEMTMLSPPIWCLMRKSVDICRIPTRTGTFKFPKLSEAYQHFTGKEVPTKFRGSVFEILSEHLEIRNAIYLGIRKYEADQLSTAARPFVRTEWT